MKFIIGLLNDTNIDLKNALRENKFEIYKKAVEKERRKAMTPEQLKEFRKWFDEIVK